MRGRWLKRRFARSIEGTRSCSVRRRGWRIVVDCQPTSLVARSLVNTLGRSRAKGCSNANARACAVDCCSASAWMIRSWGSPDAWSGLTAAPTALTNHAVHRSGVRVVRFEHTTPSPPGDGQRYPTENSASPCDCCFANDFSPKRRATDTTTPGLLFRVRKYDEVARCGQER